LLAFGLEALGLAVEDHVALHRRLLSLPGLGDRCDERDGATLLEDLVRGLAGVVEIPVARRVRVG
jgi:hypothetical protein